MKLVILLLITVVLISSLALMPLHVALPGDAALASATPSQPAALASRAAPVATPLPPTPTPPLLPTPTAALRAAVTAVGDSVMLAAAGRLGESIAGLDLDAEVGRQFAAGIGILRARRDAGQLGAIVLIHLGNNGPISSNELDELMQLLSGAQRVILVNLKVPRAWEETNNALLAGAAGRYANVELVDWHAASIERSECFREDGLHLRPEGAQAYTELLMGRLRAP